MKMFFLIKESFRGYRASKLSFFLTVFTCFISLGLLGIFSYLFLNAHLLVEEMKDRIEIEVFLSDSLSSGDSYTLVKRIKSLPPVLRTQYISKEKAKEIFIKETGIDFQSVLSANPLPASIKIELKDESKNEAQIRTVLSSLKKFPGINDIVFNQELLLKIQERAKLFQQILMVIFVLVTLATVYIISNTIKLNIYNKLDDIKTMRLVGAKPYFIKMPFILEGIIVGFSGGTAAAVLLIGIEILFEYFFSIKSKLTTQHVALISGFIIICGVLFGYLGSLVSIRKFFKKSIF